MEMYTNKARIEWVDIAKGIGILLVIIGHTVDGMLQGAIYSFHMPLFFILSCITFKFSVNKEMVLTKLERSFAHLVIPAFIVYGISTAFSCVYNHVRFLSLEELLSFFSEVILSGIFASGVDVNIKGMCISAIGIPWFLIVLFIGRTIFDYLTVKIKKEKKLLICIICLSLIGVMMGKIQWLPLSFDVCLAVLPFFWIGKEFYRIKIENNTIKKFISCFLLWALLLMITYILAHNYMSLAARRYTLYPLCYLIGILGTVMIGTLSVHINRWRWIAKPIGYLGKNSLYMLCIHKLDVFLEFAWKISDNVYVNTICRLLLDIFIFAFFMLVYEGIKRKRMQYKK